MSSAIHRVIVGTAGHIDHGKSSLVRCLTGIDPDRLKEERDRGMTIDLGFAPYRTHSGETVGIIDVPGHERFVKNMVAGASSVDIFLLVVAADDGVMPQTREHVEILDLLGARKGLVVVTKIDLVDPELCELAVDEIREYLAETSFRDAPLVPVSATTLEGIDHLRSQLDDLIAGTRSREATGLFRMPIQRVFSAPGHGTILTGVPLSGTVAVGQMLEVLPKGFRGKLRAIEAYREKRNQASAGHSTALNLSDIDYHQVRRGDVVCAPGLFQAAHLFEARLRYLDSAPRPLKHGAEVRLHLGTAESLARVVLLDQPILLPGQEALVQFRLRDPLVGVRGDAFLIRQVSPMVTLGGGTIVAESSRRLARGRPEAVESVRAKLSLIDDLPAYLERLLLERGGRPSQSQELAGLLKCPEAEAALALEGLLSTGAVAALDRGRIVHTSAFEAGRQAVLSSLSRFHEEHPLRAYCDVLFLRQAARLDPVLFDGVLKSLLSDGQIVSPGRGRVGLKDARPKLSPAEEQSLSQLAEIYAGAGWMPPAPGDLVERTGLPQAKLSELLELLAERGDLRKVGDHFFQTEQVDRALEILKQVARESGGEIVVPRLRDALQTTRKYLIPLLEYFDSSGRTVRRGERRYYVEQVGKETR